MERIVFDRVLPQFLCGQKPVSDVWNSVIGFERGRTYLVQASSGTGKSTMCSYMIGYRHDYEGRVLLDDVEAKGLGEADWVDVKLRHVSHLFQELRLFPELTAMENVLIKNRLTGHLDEKRIVGMFDELGIGDKTDTVIGRMSFGQQQRVALIRAVAQPFDFIVLDEPVSHLDDANAGIMAGIIIEEARRQGAGIIVTSIGKHMDMNYDAVVRL